MVRVRREGAKALMNDLFSMGGEVPIGRWKMIPM